MGVEESIVVKGVIVVMSKSAEEGATQDGSEVRIQTKIKG